MENVKTPVSLLQTDYGSTTSSADILTPARLKIAGDQSAQEIDKTTDQRVLFGSPQARTPSFLPLTTRHHGPYNRMSFDMKPNSEVVQIAQRFEFFLNVINQICIGFVTIYMTWLCLHTGLRTTALHAWLVTLGFSFLMAEAVMCHYKGNVIFHHYKRTTKTTMHWILQVMGGGLGITGILIKCIDKGFLLTSTHGKLGFSAFILCVISMLSGLTALFSARFKQLITPILNKTFHYVLGLTTFAIALTAQYYGYQTGFFSRKVTRDFQLMMQVITLLSLLLTAIGPIKALYHKIKNIIRHFS